jgi:hypothetical protein
MTGWNSSGGTYCGSLSENVTTHDHVTLGVKLWEDDNQPDFSLQPSLKNINSMHPGGVLVLTGSETSQLRDRNIQEVIFYCGSRLRAAVITTANASARKSSWLQLCFMKELVTDIDHVLGSILISFLFLIGIHSILHRNGSCCRTSHKYPSDHTDVGIWLLSLHPRHCGYYISARIPHCFGQWHWSRWSRCGRTILSQSMVVG